MKLQIFSRKLKDSLTTNQILSIGLVACVLLALLQQFKINQMRERIVLQPPGLTERAEIGTSAANEPYYKSWGIFVASLVGSVTPSESEAALKVMEPYFTREAWLPVRSHINSIRLDPNYQQYAAVNQFMPKLAIYEPSTKKTFIQGTQKTSVYRDNKAVPLSQVEVTYEMNIVIQSGIPKVASITSYRGPAHTLEWAQRFPSTAAAFKAEQAKQADQLTPQLSPTSIEPGAMDSGEPARLCLCLRLHHKRPQRLRNRLPPRLVLPISHRLKHRRCLRLQILSSPVSPVSPNLELGLASRISRPHSHRVTASKAKTGSSHVPQK